MSCIGCVLCKHERRMRDDDPLPRTYRYIDVYGQDDGFHQGVVYWGWWFCDYYTLPTQITETWWRREDCPRREEQNG